MLLNKIDQYGKIGWFTVTVVSLWLAWPIGFAVIAYLAGSGRLRAWRTDIRMPGTWFNTGAGASGRGWAGFRSASSGNEAFDDYREQALRRLEEEQREFQSFLERLRKARDKEEFDAFMAERRQRPANGTTPVSTAA